MSPGLQAIVSCRMACSIWLYFYSTSNAVDSIAGGGGTGLYCYSDRPAVATSPVAVYYDYTAQRRHAEHILLVGGDNRQRGALSYPYLHGPD